MLQNYQIIMIGCIPYQEKTFHKMQLDVGNEPYLSQQ